MTKAKLLEAFSKYVLPFVWDKIVDWIKDVASDIADRAKQEKASRAYAKVGEVEQKKYDAVVKNPASTPAERADAYENLINAKPVL